MDWWLRLRLWLWDCLRAAVKSTISSDEIKIAPNRCFLNAMISSSVAAVGGLWSVRCA